MEVQWKFNGESFYHMEISMFDFRSKCPKHESLIDMSKPGLGVHPANSSQPRFFPRVFSNTRLGNTWNTNIIALGYLTWPWFIPHTSYIH